MLLLVEATFSQILATFSQIFDPIGIIQPLLIVPKLLIRTLCKLKLSWDDPIPADQERVWSKWLSHVSNINSLSVDRCLIPSVDFKRVEIHACSDASSEAYASVVFLRVVFEDRVKVNFVMGKCKIAPVKQALTIPKLRVCLFAWSKKLLSN